MLPGSTSQRFQVLVTATSGIAALILTLVICFLIIRVNGIYVGGLVWPFFTDLGREGSAYCVFAVGLSVVALSLSSTWAYNSKYQQSVVTGTTPREFSKYISITTTLAVYSPFCLAILAVFGPVLQDTIHVALTSAFFFFQTVAIVLNTATSYELSKPIQLACPKAIANKLNSSRTSTDNLQSTFQLQLVVCLIVVVTYIVYSLGGLLVSYENSRVTIQSCLEMHLGETYCTSTMKFDKDYTDLWNYANDFTTNQIRALMQTLYILALVGYTCSFITHDYNDQPLPDLAALTSPRAKVYKEIETPLVAESAVV